MRVTGLQVANLDRYSAALVLPLNQMLSNGLSAMRTRTEFTGDPTPPSHSWRLRANLSSVGGLETQSRERPFQSAPTWHVRSRSHQALIEAEVETHHRQLWDHAPIGLLVVDAVGTILSSNEQAREMLITPRSRPAAVALANCINNEDVVRLNQYIADVFRGEAVSSIDVQLLPSGEMQGARYVRLTAISVASLAAAFTLADITELKGVHLELEQMEERLRQLQRLELLHAMSAGIAHDFKNIMHVIESYAAILNGQTGANTQSNPVAQQIMTAASRGTMLANRWLAFGRHGEIQKQRVDVGQFVVERMECIEHSLSASIRIEKHCAAPIECELDPCLFEQVLFNLCLNARDAMPRGGVLKIGVERVEFDSQESSQGLLPAGVYAKITVADNGTGMSPEILDRIFEPFFSTKESYAGTGLGLALVRGIISEHQGAIEVWSQIDIGSTFTVYLPAIFGVR